MSEVAFINGLVFKKMIISGANALVKNKDMLDALNVFPVPDGDTGTNMSLTMMSSAKEAQLVNSENIFDIAKAVSSGSLRGARGNSGVIVSQIFRGFARGLEGCENATVDDFANAFVKASETAYKAVMKPKEGTILTIAREMGEKAYDMSFATDDVAVFLRSVLDYAYEILKKTTDMLPALKQANVVDAGGKGLLCFWEAAYSALTGQDEVILLDNHKASEAKTVMNHFSDTDILFAYCTELLIEAKNITDKTVSIMRDFLDKIGDSIVVVADGDLLKLHVHTNNPGKALEKAAEIGSMVNIKIENMKIQHTNNLAEIGSKNEDRNIKDEKDDETNTERKEVGFIAVSAGDGFKELFLNLGVDYVVEGGQTMNPSTEDFIKAIGRVNADTVFIFPNNKNIILAASQSAELITDKQVVVIPTRSIPQGITGIINYNNSMSVDMNIKELNDKIQFVHTGQVTYAVRDTVIDDKEIIEGDVLCLYDGRIEFVEKSLKSGVEVLLEYMTKQEGEIVTIYEGTEADAEITAALEDFVVGKNADLEVEIQYGGQPLYHYVLSIE